MPTYDYRCKACGHELEIFQSMTAKPKRKCPACGESKLERLIGAGAGFLFKGSGYYLTDYRSDSYKKAAEKDGPSQPSPSSSESKPEGAPKKPEEAPKKADGSSTESASEPPKKKTG